MQRSMTNLWLCLFALFAWLTVAWGETLTVTVSRANVRQGPGLTYRVLTTLPSGATFPVLSTQNGWHQIQLDDGREAWIVDSIVRLEASDRPTEWLVSGTSPLSKRLGRALSPTAVDENGWTDLHYAAALNLPELAKALLDAGADAAARLKDDHAFGSEWLRETLSDLLGSGYSAGAMRLGQTPLHVAAMENAGETAVVLIEHGANVNVMDKIGARGSAHPKQGRTPLHRAAAKDANKVAAVLIEHGADVNAKAESGNTPLYYAAKYGATAKIAAMLIEHGADVNNALYWAVLGNTSMVALLIEHGADVNAKTKNGRTPLHMAARRNADKVAAVLIQHGADVSAQSRRGGMPLEGAVRKNYAEVAAVLIEGGVNLKATNTYGETWLHNAAQQNADGVVAVMIERGANVNAKDKFGWTPLHRASSGRFARAAATLIEGGANVNARNNAGMTPLHLAASLSLDRIDLAEPVEKVVAVLVKRGADINAKDSKGKTPLHRATSRTAPVLIEHGADVNAKDKNGETPLDMAERNNLDELATLLRRAMSQ